MGRNKIHYTDEQRKLIKRKENQHLKEKDVKRMNEIIQKTGCTFYRYNEKHNMLTSNTLTLSPLTGRMW